MRSQNAHELSCASSIGPLSSQTIQGVPMARVAGDEVCGDAPYLRDDIARAGKKYVLGVLSTTPVWRDRPPVEEPTPGPVGRRGEKSRLADGATAAETVAAVIAALLEGAWKRLTGSQGEEGPRTCDWVAVRVIESPNRVPGTEGCLLARPSILDPTDLAHHLGNAPQDTPLAALAEIASGRSSIETAIDERNGETRLDAHKVRYWPGWHRHIILSMMGHAWLASIRQAEGERERKTQCWPR